MPVAWDDLTDVSPSDFTVRTVPPLVEKGKDPWASMPDSVGSIEGALAWWERDVADGLPELNFPPGLPEDAGRAATRAAVEEALRGLRVPPGRGWLHA